MKLFLQWRERSVIFITQLKFILNINSYNWYWFHYFVFVHIKENIEVEKFYEVEKLVNRRIRRYEKKNVIQYLIQWIEYKSKYDEWKNLSTLNNFLNLVKVYEWVNFLESTFSIISIKFIKKRDRFKKSSKKLNWRLYQYEETNRWCHDYWKR